MEEWKDISGYEGLYQISSLGNLRSSTKKAKKSKIMKHHLRAGYARCNLYKDGIRKKYVLHRLVAEAFIENPEGHNTVHHINGIRNDNRMENLAWVTYEQNMVRRMFSIDEEIESKERIYNYILNISERNSITKVQDLLDFLAK